MLSRARERVRELWNALCGALKARGRQVLSIFLGGALQLAVSFVVSLLLYRAIYQVRLAPSPCREEVEPERAASGARA